MAGNASLTLGDGDNTADLAHAYSIFGNFNISMGNGNDTFTVGTAATTISGNLNITLGNGTDSVTVAAVPSGTLTYAMSNVGGSDGSVDAPAWCLAGQT